MRYETFPGEDGYWRLKMVAINGDVTIRPEKYKTRQECEFMIDLYKKNKSQKPKTPIDKKSFWRRLSEKIWGSED